MASPVMLGVDPDEAVTAAAEAQGDAFRIAGDLESAVSAYSRAAGARKLPPAHLCLKLARSYERLGRIDQARSWLMRVVDGGDDFVAWQGAAAMIDRCQGTTWPASPTARLSVLGRLTTPKFVPLLRAGWRRGGL